MKTLVQLYEAEIKLDNLKDYYSTLIETEDKEVSSDEPEND